jgi:pimeloyl-ACP methyl ester carboxylesterase
VAAARNAPHLAEFASIAVMEMARRIGPEAMLRQLCKESPSDLALIEDEEIASVLAANIALMAEDSAGAARAFAREYVAFQGDWSASIAALRDLPVRVLIAEEDPTIDVAEIARLREAYPWMEIEAVPDTGLALTFQIPQRLVPMMVDAARAARAGG